jgi:chromate transporter
MSLLLLYVEFFKIGVFSVGGGLATLPFLYQMADRYEWLAKEKVADFLAIAQSSPGAIGVNMAAQAGFLCAGLPGAILAVLGLVSPAIAVIVLIARMLAAFKENKTVASVFSGLRPAAAGLLAAACFGALKISLYNNAASAWHEIIRLREFVIFAVLFPLVFRFRVHPIVYIAVGAAAGVALGL